MKNWSKPTVITVPCGMEVTAYCSATMDELQQD